MKLLLLCFVFAGCVAAHSSFSKFQAVVVNGSSGFQIDSFIVTANHVATENFAMVKDLNGHIYLEPVVARDTFNDIALIHSSHYYPYEIAVPHPQEAVYSIADPAGLEFSELEGRVENIDRYLSGSPRYQIGIDVYYGSSGSPLYNGKGEIIGMLTTALPGTRFSLAVPAYIIQSLIQSNRQ